MREQAQFPLPSQQQQQIKQSAAQKNQYQSRFSKKQQPGRYRNYVFHEFSTRSLSNASNPSKKRLRILNHKLTFKERIQRIDLLISAITKIRHKRKEAQKQLKAIDQEKYIRDRKRTELNQTIGELQIKLFKLTKQEKIVAEPSVKQKIQLAIKNVKNDLKPLKQNLEELLQQIQQLKDNKQKMKTEIKKLQQKIQQREDVLRTIEYGEIALFKKQNQREKRAYKEEAAKKGKPAKKAQPAKKVQLDQKEAAKKKPQNFKINK